MSAFKELQDKFIQTSRELFQDKHIEEKALIAADIYNGFEDWLNWELLFAFEHNYRWPNFSVGREWNYPNLSAKRADIAISEGRNLTNDANTLRVETKLIWNNAWAEDRIAGAVSDAQRIHAVGSGILFAVVVSATILAKTERWPLLTESPDTILEMLDEQLGSPVKETKEIIWQCAAQGREYWLAPKILGAVYRIG